MQYLFILKSAGPSTPPGPALMEAMHSLAQREIAAGRMIADGGLMPRAMASEVKLSRRKIAVLDGPFAETKEAIAGFAIFELPDRAAAIESAVSFLSLHQQHAPEAEITMEVREIAGSHTLGVGQP